MPRTFLACLLIVGCGGDAKSKCLAGATIQCGCPGGSDGTQVCLSDGTLGDCMCLSGTGTSGTNGSSTNGGSTNGGGTTATNGSGPIFLSFGANVDHLTEGQSVTFSAVLTTRSGEDGLAGGTLQNADGSVQYGPFDAGAQKGAFSLALGWDAINQAETLQFDGSEPLTFTAVFFDTLGNSSSRNLTLTLTCGSKIACGGHCVDPMSDGANCNGCGNDCGMGACYQGSCERWSDCVQSNGPITCTWFCAQRGYTCATHCDPTFEGAALILSPGAACDSTDGTFQDGCDDPLPQEETARCCCL